MKLFCVANDRISQRDLEVLELIRKAIEALPNGPKWTCHSVVRIVSPLSPGFKVSDGYFANAWAHSWLQSPTAIIDVYPVAGSAPILVSTLKLSPWADLYRQANLADGQIETARRLVGKFRSGLINIRDRA